MGKDAQEEKLEQILAAVNEIKLFYQGQEIRLSALEVIARQSQEAIKGNGKPGLETEVALLKDNATPRADFAVLKDNMSRINWFFGATALLVTGDIVSRILSGLAK